MGIITYASDLVLTQFDVIFVSSVFSYVAFLVTLNLVPGCSELLLRSKICGVDLHKRDRYRIPESLGLLSSSVYIVFMFVFLPIPFVLTKLNGNNPDMFDESKLLEYITGILAICCMVLLGFVDDILNLRWKYKVFLPAISSLPILTVYYTYGGTTFVKLPAALMNWIGRPSIIDLGILYYIYMMMLVVFCTNSINIYAGINGLEVGQAIIIAVSILVNNAYQLFASNIHYTNYLKNHLWSFVIILPFFGTSLPLLLYNWYPASVFVGDTYCYFAGMVFAVSAIFGHFSKTLLLFFIPQVLNFGYSLPQLTKLIPCPRHRTPIFNRESEMLEMSMVRIKITPYNKNISSILVHAMHKLGLICMIKDKQHQDTKNTEFVYVNNMTLINLFLYKMGPQKENALAKKLLIFQMLMSMLGLVIRNGTVHIFYDE